MTLFDQQFSIKIKNVQLLSMEPSSVNVAARANNSLALRLSGSADFTIGNTRVHSGTNDVFFMPSNCSYYAKYTEKNEIISIIFESDLRVGMENFTAENLQKVSLLFQKIYDIWQEKEEGYYFSAVSLLCEIIKELSVQQTRGVKNQTTEAFERAVAYIEEHMLSPDFSVEDAVSVACVSNTYFRKLFVAKYGVTPIEYVVTQRLAYAETLLSTGEYSVGQVAEMSGFHDAKYFSRAIKKAYGVPPSRLYRHMP